jgi:hypothetical protein
MDTDKFPNLPSDGDTILYNGRTYTFSKEDNIWYAPNLDKNSERIQLNSYSNGIQIATSVDDITNDILWDQIRFMRDKKLQDLDWRYVRYNRLQRLNLTQIDDIVKLDTYTQALADITKQGDPYSVVWPTL